MRTETVAESFATYRDHVLPKDAPPVQVEECRRAFYAGSYFLLMNIAYNIGDDFTDEDQGIVELEKLQAEIEAFGKAGGMPLPTPVPPAPVVTVPDINYTTADADEMRPILITCADYIKGELPTGWGFSLLLFTFGEGGSLFYVANAERADVLNAMHEFIRRQTS